MTIPFGEMTKEQQAQCIKTFHEATAQAMKEHPGLFPAEAFEYWSCDAKTGECKNFTNEKLASVK